jgi:hypothetical protein
MSRMKRGRMRIMPAERKVCIGLSRKERDAVGPFAMVNPQK